jgi:Protein of unknown function (DUF2561)
MATFNTPTGVAPSEKFAPDSLDRGLIAACAVVWLLALGAGVAAVVALVDLGRGHSAARPGESGTPWLLYSVIAVSALVIALAVPLLLRARRDELSNAPDGPVARAATPLSAARALRVSGRAAGYPGPVPNRFSSAVISDAELERLWLRGGLGVLTVTGVAMIAVAAATYLMAVGSDGVAWALYAVAGIVTVAMIAIPVLLVRQLQAQLAAADFA